MLEVMISVLILGAMIVPSLTMLGSVAASYSRQANRDIARCLGHELMSEIKKGEFADPNPELRVFGREDDESQDDRLDFDDIDDYHGVIDSPPTSANGEPMPGFDEFSRSVEVVFVRPANIQITSASATSLIRIRVTVSHPSVDDYVVEMYRSDNGPGATEFGASANYVRHMGMELRLDGQSTSTRNGVEIRNKVPLSN